MLQRRGGPTKRQERGEVWWGGRMCCKEVLVFVAMKEEEIRIQKRVGAGDGGGWVGCGSEREWLLFFFFKINKY